VTSYEPNRVRLTEDLWNAKDRESAVRRRVATALRRHRAFSTLVRLAERAAGSVSSAEYARELPNTFPAVSVSTNTWLVYARAFILWFEYAGLVETEGQLATICAEGEGTAATRMFGFRPPVRTKGVFPQRPPGPTLAVLRRIATAECVGDNLGPDEMDGLRELLALGAVKFTREGRVDLVRPELISGTQINAECLRELMMAKEGCKAALGLLEHDAAASPAVVGQMVGKAHGAEWSTSTAHSVGKHLRSWARLAGVRTTTRRPRSRDLVNSRSDLQLGFDELE
jgi:hypothetical protein